MRIEGQVLDGLGFHESPRFLWENVPLSIQSNSNPLEKAHGCSSVYKRIVGVLDRTLYTGTYALLFLSRFNHQAVSFYSVVKYLGPAIQATAFQPPFEPKTASSVRSLHPCRSICYKRTPPASTPRKNRTTLDALSLSVQPASGIRNRNNHHSSYNTKKNPRHFRWRGSPKTEQVTRHRGRGKSPFSFLCACFAFCLLLITYLYDTHFFEFVNGHLLFISTARYTLEVPAVHPTSA